MRPLIDPWRDLKKWYCKQILLEAPLLMLLWAANILILGRMAGRTLATDIWILGIIVLAVPFLPMSAIRSGSCPFLCPRCGRRFFGWKPQSLLRHKRALKCAVVHLARGPIKRKPKRNFRECALSEV